MRFNVKVVILMAVYSTLVETQANVRHVRIDEGDSLTMQCLPNMPPGEMRRKWFFTRPRLDDPSSQVTSFLFKERGTRAQTRRWPHLRADITIDVDTFTLHIARTNVVDTGLYTCEVTSSDGRRWNHSFNVTIIDYRYKVLDVPPDPLRTTTTAPVSSSDGSGEDHVTTHALENEAPVMSETRTSESGNIPIFPIIGTVCGLVVIATAVSIYCHIRRSRLQRAEEKDVQNSNYSLPDTHPYGNEEEDHYSLPMDPGARQPSDVTICRLPPVGQTDNHISMEYELPWPPPPLPEPEEPRYTPMTGRHKLATTVPPPTPPRYRPPQPINDHR